MNEIDVGKLDLNDLIKTGVVFHGHLGPFLVVGIRMGIIALNELNSGGYSDIDALVETGTTPPISCLIDGIQVSTGCTLGKGNIQAIANKNPEPKAVFRSVTGGGKTLEIELKPEIMEEILEGGAIEEFAGRIATMTDKELFNMKVTPPWEDQGCDEVGSESSNGI